MLKVKNLLFFFNLFFSKSSICLFRYKDIYFFDKPTNYRVYLEPKSDIFRGFELKLTKQDFHSSAAHTFIYNYNYYLMPYSLFQEIEEEIPDFVGVWVCYDSSMDIQCIKRPKKQKLQCNHDDLLFSMFQSLSREFNKQKIKEFELKTTKKGKIK